MPENSLKIISSSPVISIDRHRDKKASSKYNKPHCIIPVDDLHWVINQTKTIQTLWNECWACDQYGSRWMRLKTSLGDKAFRLARQVLHTAGLFEFKRETCIDDSRKTAGWLVKNLHGARRIQEFWLANDQNDGQKIPDISPEESTGKNDCISGINGLNNILENPISGQKMPDISPETPEKSSIPAPLSNSSETSQELLKEVSEKKESTTAELFERVRSYANEKIAQKLKGVLERCGKRFHTEQPKEDYYKDLFTSRYNWRIDQDRLSKILELNNQCQQQLINKFKYIYDADGMSAPRTFDKAFSQVTNNAFQITEQVKRQFEYFQQVWEVREQMLGNNSTV